MNIALAHENTALKLLRHQASNLTIEQLDADPDFRRIEIGEIDFFNWVEEGYDEQEGVGHPITVWAMVDGDSRGYDLAVVAARTGREDVLIDTDICAAAAHALFCEISDAA